jgi:hypothetical protein
MGTLKAGGCTSAPRSHLLDRRLKIVKPRTLARSYQQEAPTFWGSTLDGYASLAHLHSHLHLNLHLHLHLHLRLHPYSLVI